MVGNCTKIWLSGGAQCEEEVGRGWKESTAGERWNEEKCPIARCGHVVWKESEPRGKDNVVRD